MPDSDYHTSSTMNCVLVTGASGFIASHIVKQLLEAGYTVRGTARGAKVSYLRKAFARYGDRFQSVEVSDISEGDFTHILEGVQALIHSAAALPGRTDVESAMKAAVEGSVNILTQAYKAGIKRVVFTSSVVTFTTPSGPFGVNDWNPIKKEDALADYWSTYRAAKTFADQAAVEFAQSHADLDLTLLGPSWVFGPLVAGFEELIPEPDFKALSTNGYVYSLLDPAANAADFSRGPGYIDVRDVARAHVLAISAPRAPKKRFALISPYPASYADSIHFLREVRPELKERLADPEQLPSWKSLDLLVDRQRIEDVIGLKVESYKNWRETVMDTIDSLIELENSWRSKGFEIRRPTGPTL